GGGAGGGSGPRRHRRRIGRTGSSPPAASCPGVRELPISLLKKSERVLEASGFPNKLRILLSSPCSASPASCVSGTSVGSNSRRRSPSRVRALGPPVGAPSSQEGRMTPNHSGGAATSLGPRATSSDSSGLEVV